MKILFLTIRGDCEVKYMRYIKKYIHVTLFMFFTIEWNRIHISILSAHCKQQDEFESCACHVENSPGDDVVYLSSKRIFFVSLSSIIKMHIVEVFVDSLEYSTGHSERNSENYKKQD